jgi:ferric-dicitrate binding protein FerR (iron transport regulator)
MNLHLPTVQLALEAQAPLSIHEGRATRLSVLEGTVWITEEGRFEDFFVNAGQDIVLQGRGRAVLLADRNARIEVRSAEPVVVKSGSNWLSRLKTTLFPSHGNSQGERALTVF